MSIFETPMQVLYYEKEDETYAEYTGIAYNDYIICCGCGGVIPLEEVEIVKIYSNWQNLSNAIQD